MSEIRERQAKAMMALQNAFTEAWQAFPGVDLGALVLAELDEWEEQRKADVDSYRSLMVDTGQPY